MKVLDVVRFELSQVAIKLVLCYIHIMLIILRARKKQFKSNLECQGGTFSEKKDSKCQNLFVKKLIFKFLQCKTNVNAPLAIFCIIILVL